MSWFNPLPAFSSVSSFVNAQGLSEELGAAAIIAIASLFYARIRSGIRTHQLLRQINHPTHLPEDTVRGQHIDFIPSGVINPVTGNEFVDMHVTPFGVFSVTAGIDHDLAVRMQNHISRARDDSTTAKPVLYDNMDFVSNANERNNIGHIISRAIKNGTAHLLNRKDPGLVQHLGPRQRPIYATKLLLLVAETCHELKEVRLLSVDPDDLVKLPPIEDVRVDHNDGLGFQSIPDDPKLSRYAMMQGVADFVQRMRAQGQIQHFQTKVPTGQIEYVPDPFAPPIPSRQGQIIHVHFPRNRAA